MMRALAWAALLALVVPWARAAGDCETDLPAEGRLWLRGGGAVVVLAPSPAPVPVGRPFSLQVQVCPDPGAAPARLLRVDADMPAHRHGMNYRPTVHAQGAGRFLVEGLLFHMPGRWRLRLELDHAGKPLRLDQALDVR